MAEDSEINREIEKRILKTFGLTVVCASDGQEALDLFKSSKPKQYDAVLMDIQMPVLNGFEATAAIRCLPRPDAKKVPIIAMTADAFSAAIEHSKAVGMDDYVTKPLDVRGLQETVSKYLLH